MRRKAVRTLAYGGGAVALAVAFAAGLVGGIVLHAGTPAFRRTAETVGNRVLGTALAGSIVVRNVKELSVGPRGRLRVAEAEAFDPEGHRVILARDVEATIDLVKLIRSLAGGGAPVVELGDTRIDQAEIVLDADPSGGAKIARTFAPRPKPGAAAPAPPTPAPTAGVVAPEPTVHVPNAVVRHARVHGDLVPPALDGDIDDVAAKFALEHDVATITLVQGTVTLREPRLPAQKQPIVGVARGHLQIVLATTTLHGDASLVGFCGGIPVTAHAKINGDLLEATIDVARTNPDGIATAFAGLPLTEPLEVHAHARGRLPTIGLDARGRLGAASFTGTGEIDLREGRAFRLDVDASHVDAHAFGAGITTDLGGKVHGEGVLETAGGRVGTFRVQTTEGAAAGERIPPTVIEGRFEGQRVTANVRASEPGVDASGTLTFDGRTEQATFDVQARSSSLGSLARAPGRVHGAASIRTKGAIDVAKMTIQATANASGDGISLSGISARRATAQATVRGPIAAPLVDVGFDADDLAVTANGKAPLLYEHADGRAKISLVPTPRILRASVNVRAPGVATTVTMDGVRFDGGVVEARGLKVTGLGDTLELDARIGDGTWNIRAKSSGIDLRRAATLTGLRELQMVPPGTRAMIDIDLHDSPAGPTGHFDVVVRTEEGFFGGGALVAEAHGTSTRGNLVATARVAAEGFGQIEVTRAELDLPGRLDARSLARTTGTVELRGALDLAQGAALFAGEKLERVGGIARLEGRIERGDPNALPAMRGTVRTEGLEVVLASETTSAPSKEISGAELVAHVAWDGRSEDGEVAVIATDARGVLVSASAKTRAPLLAWAMGTKKLDAAAVGALEVAAVADIPDREVSELPRFLGITGVRGRVGSHLRVEGTVEHPAVAVTVRADGLDETHAAAGGSRSFEPLDGTLEARWDGRRAALTFGLEERARQRRTRRGGDRPEHAGDRAHGTSGGRPGTPGRGQPGHLRGLLILSELRIADLLHGRRPEELPWRGSAEIEVENLSLAALPLPTHVTGALTGRASVRDVNHDPSFEGKVHVDGLGTAGTTVESTDVSLQGHDQGLFARADIVDAKSKVTVQLTSESLRMHGVDLGWDPGAKTRLDYAVENGRLALLGPLVRQSISEIDGRVDGTGSVTIDATGQAFEGGLAVHEAALYVNALGEEITGLAATARFERTGSWRIDDATGKVGTGEFRASASGRMKGLSFVDAEAVVVATKGGIPLSSESATFAEATGVVKINAAMAEDKKALLVTVEVPQAEVQLPDRSTQQLESLDPDKTITVGVRNKRGKLDASYVRVASGGTGKTERTGTLPIRITVTLGNEVRLEGRGLNVTLGGRTLVEVADELRVTGQIDLRGGTIEVHGRRFTVDRGVVTFLEGGNPSDPTVVAAAYWDAPDRTRVWVEFVGPITTGKLSLRSEPPFTKNEILSVLLFGRPDPNMAAASGQKTGDASGATAVGSGFVAGDLNRVLSEIDENLDIETDTLSGNRTRTKLGRSFFDRRLKVQIGYAPGRTYREPDTTYVFLNWQFIPKWALVATRGDRGTSILDVLFQHRY